MNQNIERRLRELERIVAVNQEAEAYRIAQASMAEKIGELLIRFGAEEKIPGESKADNLARGLGMSTLELKNLIHERSESHRPLIS